jgi:hypothetical protein
MSLATDGRWSGDNQAPGDSHRPGDGEGVFVIHATLMRTAKSCGFRGTRRLLIIWPNPMCGIRHNRCPSSLFQPARTSFVIITRTSRTVA